MAPRFPRRTSFGGVVAEPVAAYVPPPVSPDASTIEYAKTTLGVKDPAPKPKKLERPKSVVRSMRETLLLDPDDIIALFDTVIDQKTELTLIDAVIPAATLQHRIDRLKKIVAASKEIIEGLAVNVMKIRRGKDDVLDKATREKYKREETARITRSNAKLFKYRNALKAGNYTEKIWAWVTVPVHFSDVFSGSTTFEEWGEWNYETDKPRYVGGLMTHFTEAEVSYVEWQDVFDLSSYKKLMRLGDEALEILGTTEAEQQRAWKYWQVWEDWVIVNAIKHGILHPRRDLLALIGLTAYVPNEEEQLDVEADTTENALAIKTGGACYGGGIRSAGYRYRNGRLRQRALETFDKGKPPAGGDEADFRDPGFESMRNVHDDAESYQPD